MKLIIRWAAITLALFAAVYFVPGISVDDPNAWTVFAVMAAILGLVNAIIRPILRFLSCPLIILTLGVFAIVINGLSFYIASRIAEAASSGSPASRSAFPRLFHAPAKPGSPTIAFRNDSAASR